MYIITCMRIIVIAGFLCVDLMRNKSAKIKFIINNYLIEITRVVYMMSAKMNSVAFF